ncbi:MAG: VOC family protein [Candidatus Thermoplasmatota archaeon]|nr:VOC family protein [Candidatus Thermoplasmatota archaeon]
MTLPSDNLEGMKRFYSKILGFPIKEEKDGEFFEVATGIFDLCINFVPKSPGRETVKVDLIFENPELKEVEEVLEREGIKYNKIVGSRGRIIVFDDPEGNKIEVTESF